MTKAEEKGQIEHRNTRGVLKKGRFRVPILVLKKGKKNIGEGGKSQSFPGHTRAIASWEECPKR